MAVRVEPGGGGGPAVTVPERAVSANKRGEKLMQVHIRGSFNQARDRCCRACAERVNVVVGRRLVLRGRRGRTSGRCCATSCRSRASRRRGSGRRSTSESAPSIRLVLPPAFALLTSAHRLLLLGLLPGRMLEALKLSRREGGPSRIQEVASNMVRGTTTCKA